jgi:hypothetical protein
MNRLEIGEELTPSMIDSFSQAAIGPYKRS